LEPHTSDTRDRYIVPGQEQTPPSPDYVPGPEHLPSSDYVPSPVYSKYVAPAITP
nr:hypothetical protein [Tanacetum cinerariifolium]